MNVQSDGLGHGPHGPSPFSSPAKALVKAGVKVQQHIQWPEQHIGPRQELQEHRLVNLLCRFAEKKMEKWGGSLEVGSESLVQQRI